MVITVFAPAPWKGCVVGGWLAIAVAGGLGAAAHADDATTATPSIVVNAVKSQKTTTTTNTTGKGPAELTDTAITYTITIQSTSNVPGTGLTVEYHVYDKTDTSSGGNATVMLKDTSGKESLDLDALSSKDIETKAVHHKTGEPAGKKPAGGGAGAAKPAQVSAKQSLLGILVLVKQGDKELARYADPTDITDLVATLRQEIKEDKSGPGSGP
jgi:hypothetical protein